MKVMKAIPMLILILLTFKVKAQIETEIKSYTDSTELLVNNGRKLLVQALSSNNSAKAVAIHKHLEEELKENYYSAFSLREELNIYILTSNWSNWIDKVNSYNNSSTKILYPGAVQIQSSLTRIIENRCDSILKELESTELDSADKSLLKTHLSHVQRRPQGDKYIEYLRDYYNNPPQTEHNRVREKMVSRTEMKISAGLSVGSTFLNPLENFDNAFSSENMMYMGMDISFKRYFCSFHLTSGDIRLQDPVLLNRVLDTTIFKTKDKFHYFQGGVLVGYFVLDYPKFKLAPYVFIGASSLESNIYGSEQIDREIGIFNTLTVGPGLRTEVTLFGIQLHNTYGYWNPAYQDSRLNLKLKLESGYNIPTKLRYHEISGHSYYVRIALVWTGDFYIN